MIILLKKHQSKKHLKFLLLVSTFFISGIIGLLFIDIVGSGEDMISNNNYRKICFSNFNHVLAIVSFLSASVKTPITSIVFALKIANNLYIVYSLIAILIAFAIIYLKKNL
jgi:H+/Cl- antiporter ClcA